MASKNKIRPNIIVILSDDQGAWAMGCSGNKEIITPNLDRLAAEGIRFENFFCTSPVCSPARASLITGRIPSQHGIHDWISEGNMGGESIEYLKGQVAYTDILADNGYICGISGKWHLGDSIKPQKNVSHWYVHQTGGGPYYNAPMVKNGVPVIEPGYVTDVITDDALNYLDERSTDDLPFYLSVHYTAPHSPWINNHPEEILNLYKDCPFESCPQRTKHIWSGFPGNLTNVAQKDIKENLKGYFAAITAMDANIGKILGKVKELGLREDTIICFLSDNGFNCGHHGFWGKGNGTFPLNMYDTSIKVPAIMSHPGLLPQGKVCDTLISGYDFMPTLLDYVALENPLAKKLPGKSFVNAMFGRNTEDTDTHEKIVIYDEYGPVRMIRTREWKYVHRYPYGPHELYDLVNDPDELVNLADVSEKKEVLALMKASLYAWFVKYAEPSLDGSREPVTGKGQLNLAGPAGKGKKAFAELG